MEQLLSLIQMLTGRAAAMPDWVAAATALTALMPTTADNRLLDAVARFLNVLAGNVRGNRNEDWASRGVKQRERERKRREAEEKERKDRRGGKSSNLGLRPLAMIVAGLVTLLLLSAGATPLASLTPQGEVMSRASILASAAAAKAECVRAPLVRKQYRDAVQQVLAGQYAHSPPPLCRPSVGKHLRLLQHGLHGTNKWT